MSEVLFALWLTFIIVIDIPRFLLTSGLMWVICWCFSITFTWQLVIGVYCVVFLLFIATHSYGNTKIKIDTKED